MTKKQIKLIKVHNIMKSLSYQFEARVSKRSFIRVALFSYIF